MSLKIGNCTVAYLRVLITDPIIDGPVILQLAVKIGDASHLSWFKPSLENLKGTRAARNGLRMTPSNRLLLNDTLVRTERPLHVLTALCSIMDRQKPILLVTYSTQREMKLFFEAIGKQNYETKFGRVIKSVVNTLPIFQKRYPDLYREGEVDLPILAQHALKRNCSMGYFDTSRHLELLEELVSGSELRFELNENSKSWEKFFPDLYAPKNPSIKARMSDLFKKMIKDNEGKEARPNEDDPYEKRPAGGLDPESGGLLVEEKIPVQQFRDRQNFYKQLLIDRDRRRNQSDSFVAQQHETISKNRRRNNDVAFGIEPGDLNPQFGSVVVEQGPQFPDWQNSDEQLFSINQDRPRNTSDSFTAKQQQIAPKVRRPNNYVVFAREPEDLNTESGLLVEEQGPQFSGWQNSDEQLLTNQDQSVNYDRFSALEENIPEDIHQFIGEYEARRDNDYSFERQPEDPNAGIGPFVDGVSIRPLPYRPNPVNQPPVNQNQQGRDWTRDWSQEYNEFSGENDPFFP